jgi:hypothetical protein
MNNKLSPINILKITGCIIFDIALVLAFFKTFGVIFIIDPIKILFALLVLIVGLVIFNIALILPSILFKSIGIPYSVSITSLFILYAFVANILSIFLIGRSTVSYIVWEFILFGIFIFAFSVIMSFSKSATEEIRKAEKENIEKNSVKLKLMEIEATLEAKENKDDLLPSINSFIILKERIQASTPFGRINDNNSVLDLEYQINDNLSFLIEMLKSDLTGNNLVELKKMIENTRTLVVNRETLNIK